MSTKRLNFLNKGRVNLGREDQGDWGVPVSPLHPEFDSQIEPAVRPLIYAFLSQGYHPVLSCDGHSLIDNPFITLGFDSVAKRSAFRRWFADWPLFSIDDDYNGRLPANADNISSELDYFNYMFCTNYTEVCFCTVEFRSEFFGMLTNITYFKRLLLQYYASRIQRKIPRYEYLT